jgi:hypothetical protein
MLGFLDPDLPKRSEQSSANGGTGVAAFVSNAESK